jgi:Leu/Phe-tRNA-protein transferase
MTGKRSSLRVFRPHIRMHKALKESPYENRFNYRTLAVINRLAGETKSMVR